MAAATCWIRIECHFAGLFSYRLPGANSFYALASPLPSPSAVKLALVAAAIEEHGDPAAGQAVFEALRAAPVALGVPERVGASRVLVKRLKKGREDKEGQGGGFTTSFGIREYLHLGGPLQAWVEVASEAAADCLRAARRLRRLGTTDSLLHATAEPAAAPDWPICARPLRALPADPAWLRGRLVLPLNELTEKACLEHFAPVRGKTGAGAALRNEPYVLPLRVATQGANWLVYERVPFPEEVPDARTAGR